MWGCDLAKTQQGAWAWWCGEGKGLGRVSIGGVAGVETEIERKQRTGAGWGGWVGLGWRDWANGLPNQPCSQPTNFATNQLTNLATNQTIQYSKRSSSSTTLTFSRNVTTCGIDVAVYFCVQGNVYPLVRQTWQNNKVRSIYSTYGTFLYTPGTNALWSLIITRDLYVIK